MRPLCIARNRFEVFWLRWIPAARQQKIRVCLIGSPPVAISVEKSIDQNAMTARRRVYHFALETGWAAPARLTNSEHYGKQRHEVRHEDRKSNCRFRDDE